MIELEWSSSNSSMLGGVVDFDVVFIGVGCNRVVGVIVWGFCNFVVFVVYYFVVVFDFKVCFGRRDWFFVIVVFEFCGFGWVVGLVFKF